MSQRERRHFSGEEKVKILRMHLVEGAAVSDLCEKHQISPSLFYQWQRTFFENVWVCLWVRVSRFEKRILLEEEAV